MILLAALRLAARGARFGDSLCGIQRFSVRIAHVDPATSKDPLST
jgi:hypothetical protein